MDRWNHQDGGIADAGDLRVDQAGAITALEELAQLAGAPGVATGMDVTAVGGGVLDVSVSAGRAYARDGARIVQAAAATVAVPHPTAEHRWTAIVARHAEAGAGDRVTDLDMRPAGQERIVDASALAAVHGAAAVSVAAAIRPAVPRDAVLLADVASDGTLDTSRRQDLSEGVDDPVSRSLLAGPPDNLVLTVAGHRNVTLDWWWPDDSGASQVTKFQVEAIVDGASTMLDDALRGLQIRHTPPPGSMACYRVRARNVAGPAQAYAEAGVSISATDPKQPRSLVISNPNRSLSTVGISWSPPVNGADSYRIEASAGGGAYQVIASAVLSPQTYEAGPETSLAIRVYAVKSGSDQGFAAGEISLLPLGAALPSITQVRITAVSGGEGPTEQFRVNIDLDAQAGSRCEYRAEVRYASGAAIADSGWLAAADATTTELLAPFGTAFGGPLVYVPDESVVEFRARLRRRGATIRTVGPGIWSRWYRAGPI